MFRTRIIPAILALILLSPVQAHHSVLNYDGKFEFTLQVQSRNDQSTVNNQVRFLGPSPRLYRKNLEESK